jgi:hypothetical protein
MHTRSPICVAALAAALIGPQPSMAQSSDRTALLGAEVARKSEPTALSGLEVPPPPKPDLTPLSGVEVVAKRQPPPDPTPLSGIEVVAKPRATPLDGLVVTATRICPSPQSPPDKDAPQPNLVSTYPAGGQTVQPGYIVLRLTFDVPMACRGSLPQYLLADCYSDGMEVWHQSADKRSLLILCDLKPNTRYGVSINVRIPQHFRALSGREPQGGGLSFETSGAAPVTTEGGLVERDPQLAVLLNAAGPGRNARSSQTAEENRAQITEVSTVRVTPAKACLQPRDPPDQDVPAPKLVSTFPAKGQTVRPGLLELRVTFDLPMACTGGVTFRGGGGDPCTDVTMAKVHITQHWLQAWDKHTLRLLCRVEPGKRYVMTMNKTVLGQVTPWPDFKSLGGRKAPPYELTFDASDAPPVQTQEDADVEDPLMAALIEGHETDREQ